ncbi:Response regulator receiver domain-containing protein [Afipia sp. GAS231]|nr:response regulator [Afipia sp. GAS231]SDO09275.1 Response regulator receiver domain-containing protein [Afipia sp. GAS231]
MQQHGCSRPIVLIVEDEVLLRWTAVAIVEAAGFDVVEAGTGIEAISLLEKRSDIRTVFTDVEMPGSIDGIQLAHLIKTRWPSIGIMATSGQLRLREDDLPVGARFLHKPYAVANLTDALKELMRP